MSHSLSIFGKDSDSASIQIRSSYREEVVLGLMEIGTGFLLCLDEAKLTSYTFKFGKTSSGSSNPVISINREPYIVLKVKSPIL